MDIPFVVLWLAAVQSCWALRGFQGTDKGLCSESNTVRKSKIVAKEVSVTYIETYNCGVLWLDTCERTDTKKVLKTELQLYTDQVNVTVCCSGFKIENNECQPTCSTSCEHGFCSDVNKCSCHVGYTFVNTSTICTPVCTKPCQNGTCTMPETCSCHEGYTKDTSDPYKCVPICSKGCNHGKCSAPDFCDCYEGYQKHPFEDNTCVPTCSKTCFNGICVAPETCVCSTGYRKDTADPYRCLADCSRGCVHGKCTEPETCTCDKNYHEDPLDAFRCQPNYWLG